MSEILVADGYSTNPAENCERYFVPHIGKPLAEDLVRQAELREGDRVLDVACGTGIVARLAAGAVGVEGSVSGLDVIPEMLVVARSSTPRGTSIAYYEARAEAMPLPDDAFDVVLCQMGLQFFEDKLVALQEMRRVLAPGGRLLLNVPGPRARLFAILSDAMERNIGPQAAGFVNHVFSLYDTEGIGQLMGDAGLQDIDVQAGTKLLHLPAPKDFLWQYVLSTPMAALVSQADDKAREALENEVVGKWRGLAENGTMNLAQGMVTARAAA